jgi:hypothetical protein
VLNGSKTRTVLYCIISAVAGSVATIFVWKGSGSFAPSEPNTTDNSVFAAHNTAESYQVKRFTANYHFINPIISADPAAGGTDLAQVKGQITDYVNGEKQKGLASAAVYFKDLAANSWFAINPKERYARDHC